MEEYNKELVEAWYKSSNIRKYCIDIRESIHHFLPNNEDFDRLSCINHDKVGVTGDIQKALIEYAASIPDCFLKDYIETVLGNCSSHVHRNLMIEYEELPIDWFLLNLCPKITIESKEAYLIGDGLCLIVNSSQIEVRPVNRFTMGIVTFVDRYYRFSKSIGSKFNWSNKGDLWKLIGYHGQCNDEIDAKTINRMSKLNLGLCISTWQVG